MNDKKIWGALIGLALFAAYSQVRVFQIDKQLQKADRLPYELAILGTEAVQSIENAKVEAIKSLRETIASEIASVGKNVSDEQARSLENRLKQLNAEISKQEAELRSAQAKLDRTLYGLPEQVDLDRLKRLLRWKMETTVSGFWYYRSVQHFQRFN